MDTLANKLEILHPQWFLEPSIILDKPEHM